MGNRLELEVLRPNQEERNLRLLIAWILAVVAQFTLRRELTHGKLSTEELQNHILIDLPACHAP